MKQASTTYFLLHRSTYAQKTALAIASTLLLVFPSVFNDPHDIHLMIIWIIFSIVATSWSVILGFLGIFHFAQIAFFGLGAYTAAIANLSFKVFPIVGILIGAAAAGIFSLLLSIPSLRLKGPYIAVVSFGFSECIRISTSNLKATGAELGVWGISPLWNNCSKVGFYYFSLCVFVLTVIFFYLLLVSKYGIAIKAMKQSQLSSSSVGIQIFKVKIALFFISAFFAGLSGGMYVHYMSGVSPEIYNISSMIDIMVMGLVGGVNSIFSPMIGVAVVFFSLEKLRFIQDYRFIIYSVLMIVIMIFNPDGIYLLFKKVFEKLVIAFSMKRRSILVIK